MIRAGKLDRQVTILRQTADDDDYGEPLDAWSPLYTVAASKFEPRAVEAADGDEARVATVDIRVRIRHRADAPTAKDRMTMDGREYDITGVREIQRRKGFEIDGIARADD